MPTDLPLPDLDKLHASATPGPWVTTSYEGTNNAGRHCYSVCHDVGRDRGDEHRCVATVTAESEDQARSLGEWIAAIHNTWPTISARLKELEADRRALVHEIRRYASYMLQLTEEFAKDDIERYQRAMDRAHEMQRKSDDEARANPEEFEANVEQVAKATRELRK